MFGIGQGEFIVILLLAVVFLGPQRLPEVARWLAKAFHTLQGWKAEFDRQLTEIRREVEEVAEVKLTPEPAEESDDAGAGDDDDDYLGAPGEGQADANPDYSYRQEVPPEMSDAGADESARKDADDG